MADAAGEVNSEEFQVRHFADKEAFDEGAFPELWKKVILYW